MTEYLMKFATMILGALLGFVCVVLAPVWFEDVRRRLWKWLNARS